MARWIKILLRGWFSPAFATGVAAEGAVNLHTPAPKQGLHRAGQTLRAAAGGVCIQGEILKNFTVRISIQALHRPVCYEPT